MAALMDDQNKNLILASVLSFLVILIWFTLFAPETQPLLPPATDSVTAQGTEAVAGAQTGVADPAAMPDMSVADSAGTAPAPDAPRLSIDTPRLSGTISLQGDRLDDLSLKDYAQTLDPGSPMVRLLTPQGTGAAVNTADGAAASSDGGAGDKPYFARYGWFSATPLPDGTLPGPDTRWTAPEGAALTPGTPVTLRWDNGAGLVFQRTLAIDDDYLITVTQSVANSTGTAVSLIPYGMVARIGAPDSQAIWVLHEGVVRMSDGSLNEIKYDNLPELDPLPAEGTPGSVIAVAQDGWIGFTDKYWMTALVPTPGTAFTSVVKYFPNSDIYQTEVRLPTVEIAPGATGSATSMLFAGAKEWDAIRTYQNVTGIKGFVDSIDWGWFFFLTKPIFMLLHWLHGVIGNMGWAIIALTVIIKTAVFPLARKSYISMAKMKELQPEMEALKERTGGDRQKMQTEMMGLYKREKVNPASGCLPIFLQIPIFFSLYKVIFVTLELRHAPFVGWIRDLSAPDPSSILNLFGLLPYATPAVGSPLHIISLGVLPILLGVSMWLQQKLNPTPTDATQAAIFAWMPWIFMFMLGTFASGLVLYWIANNTITFVQQYTIMTFHGKRPDIFGNIRAGFTRKKAADAPTGVTAPKAANKAAAPKPAGHPAAKPSAKPVAGKPVARRSATPKSAPAKKPAPK